MTAEYVGDRLPRVARPSCRSRRPVDLKQNKIRRLNKSEEEWTIVYEITIQTFQRFWQEKLSIELFERLACKRVRICQTREMKKNTEHSERIKRLGTTYSSKVLEIFNIVFLHYFISYNNENWRLSGNYSRDGRFDNENEPSSSGIEYSIVQSLKSNRKSKELAYKTLVRPIMENGAVDWDPYRQNQIDSIEKVQRKAAKYVKMGKGHGEEIVKDLGLYCVRSKPYDSRGNSTKSTHYYACSGAHGYG
ncbi:hypothetical protein ANN_16970 [Periplaneta americana]|uniref:Uncharacterized protein n=1 Tax=Periplaneta americana TaxID=6978 RepID=A0ABQ8SS55_PERAM|nr:hypothetical protein ANN_16970 [Periplaneta americana]